MSLLDIAASPIASATLGGIGALANGILGFFQKKEDNKFQLLRMDKEKDLAVVMANIEETKQAGMLAAMREKGAGDAFTASVEADGKLRGEHRWATTLRAITRPGLTWLYQVIFLVLAGLAMVAWFNKWVETADVVPVVQYLVVAAINSATMTLSWWFGQRQMDKLSNTWGNRVSGASVGPAK
jgi:hypothetical protein